MSKSYEKDNSKEIYVIVHGHYKPGHAKFANKPGYLACYPMKVIQGEYTQKMFTKAFEIFVNDRDEMGQITGLSCEFFTVREEAVKFYKNLSSEKRKEFDRVPFTRAHVESTQKKYFSKVKENVTKEPVTKKEPEVDKKPNPPETPVTKRNLDDIYD